MTALLREATPGDIGAMHRVRLSVRENCLVTGVISEADYLAHMQTVGRSWVIESDGELVAFAAGNVRTGNIWALFVHPDHERKGYGRRLHDTMIAWLREAGCSELWLSTAPGTRAQRFYEAAGWVQVSATDAELRLQLGSR